MSGLRRLLLLCTLLPGFARPALAEDIGEVLQRSQQQRLLSRPVADADSAAALRVISSFQRLLLVAPALPGQCQPQLQLVGGELFAEAVFGQCALVASVAVGELAEGERLLMLAHEMGHLRLGHWDALRGLYLMHIPGEVSPQTTDRIAGVLGTQAHALSHQHEFQADAYGYQVVRRLGFGLETAFGLLTRQGMQPDSMTHPGTRRRVAQLRVLDAQLAHQTVHPVQGDTLSAELVSSPADGR